jgi:hypothetical protein
MGFLDDLKKAATNVASDAGKAGKVAQAQIKLKALQGDVSDAHKELGIVAYDLVVRGAIAHPELDAAVAKVREAQALVAEKEAEIAEIRAQVGDAAPAAGAEPTPSQGPAPSFSAPTEEKPADPQA